MFDYENEDFTANIQLNFLDIKSTSQTDSK